MSPLARGPVEYPIAELEPRHFEAMVGLLARADDPEVVPVRNKDHGLDARLPDPRGRTLRGWQAKRFTDDIHWGQCRASVRRALAFWRPPRITFCFAKDLSAREQEQFRTELVDHFPYVHLDFWGGSELQRRLRDTAEGRRVAAWLFSSSETEEARLRRALAVGGELRDSGQAAARQAVIQKFMDRDPHVYYSTISRSSGGPETPPAPQTFLSVTLVEDGQEVRFDASARYPGALDDLGSQPHLVFTNDEEGRRALEAVEHIAREGGRATIASGLGAVLDVVPVGLRGLFPEEGIWGPAELIAAPLDPPEPEDPMSGPVLLVVDETELGMVLSRTEPPADWEHAVHGSTGGLTLLMLARRTDQPRKLEFRLDWRLTDGEGSGREQLLAVQLMLGMLDGSSLDLCRPDGSFMARGGLDAVEDLTGWRETLGEREVFLGYVAEVEGWLGRELFPTAAPTQEDASALATTVAAIRQPENSITWTHAQLADGAELPDGDGPWQFGALQPLWIDLFGERVYVGMDLLVLGDARIVDEAQGLAIVPADGGDGRGTSHLHRPAEAPLKAARLPDHATLEDVPGAGRNDPCPCGSGIKYKRCHGR